MVVILTPIVLMVVGIPGLRKSPKKGDDVTALWIQVISCSECTGSGYNLGALGCIFLGGTWIHTAG